MRLRLPAALLTAALAAALLAAPAPAAAPYDDGLSTPQEDSYYPTYGDPGIDVLHYQLDLDWSRTKGILDGVAIITLRATEDADSFQLDLGPAMKVTRVTVDRDEVRRDHDGSVLVVDHPVTADTRYRVGVSYHGRPRPVHAPTTRSDFDTVGMRVMRGRLRTMQEPYGAHTWYPVNDQPSDKALYDVEIDAPGTWMGVSNGTLVRSRRTDSGTINRFHLEHPAASYLMTLAVGPYTHVKAKGPHGLPLHYWLPRGREERYLEVLRHVPADLRWLEKRLGRYPFESAGAVIVPGDSAMETQTLVTFGEKLWGDDPVYAREVMVHELAHQWYGDTQSPSDWSDLWLNVGMAMYLVGRWSADHTRLSWRDWSSYFTYNNLSLRDTEGGPGAYHRNMFGTSCVYTCTAAMYEQLRKRIGDRLFWSIVKQWPHRDPDGNVDRAEFEEYVEKRTGENLTRFFEDWLNSPTWPPT